MKLSYLLIFLLILPVVSADITISEFIPNPVGQDNVVMPGGEWVELYNDGTLTDLNGYYLKDKTNKKVYVTDVTTYGTAIKKNDYLVVYMNGKYGFLNNEGVEQIDLYDSEDNLVDSVSYEGSSDGLSWSLSDERWIQTMVTPGGNNYGYQPPENSTITIEKVYVGSDGHAEFGDMLRVKINVYKGSTDKYAVYAELDDISKKSQVNFYTKFTNFSVTIPIQIYPNCDENYENGKYVLKVEGLNTEAETEIELEGFDKNLCQYVDKPVATVAQKKFVYNILEYSPKIDVGGKLDYKVELINNYNVQLNLKVWGYVYRGSKSYSGERDLNLKEIILLPGEIKVVDFSNQLDSSIKAGNYKLKVLVNKNNQKTNYSVIEEIEVVSGSQCSVCSCNNNINTNSSSNNNFGSELKLEPEPDNVIYESASIVQKKVAPVLLSVVSLLGVGLIKL